MFDSTPENSWEFSSCKCAKKRGLQEKHSFWRWVSAMFYHCSLILFKLKYDIPADAHWNLEPIPISAERVPSPTYHTIYWSISGRGMDRSIGFNRSTACQPLVTETAMQAWNVRLCPARLVACGSAYRWFHVHHGTFPAFESRGLSSQLRPQVVPDFTFNIGRIRILNAFADRKWIPA